MSIAQAQASLQRVIETAPLAIALFDAATLRMQQVNQTASVFFGTPLAQLLGATPEDACPPALAAALRGWLASAAAGGARRQHDQHDQHEWREPVDLFDHARVWDCRLTRLDEGAGTATQLLLVATDVTEQRAAEVARLRELLALGRPTGTRRNDT